jgi:hypothetical protein
MSAIVLSLFDRTGTMVLRGFDAALSGGDPQ